jgi:hypothetical protein
LDKALNQKEKQNATRYPEWPSVNALVAPLVHALIDDAAASAIVYAPERLRVPQDVVWPAWTADRPKPCELIDKNRPICTVWARAATKQGARRLAQDRISEILAVLRPFVRGETFGQAFEQKRKTERRAS